MMWAKSKIWANVRRIGAPACPNCNASLLEVPKKTKVMPIDEVIMSDAPVEAGANLVEAVISNGHRATE